MTLTNAQKVETKILIGDSCRYPSLSHPVSPEQTGYNENEYKKATKAPDDGFRTRRCATSRTKNTIHGSRMI